MSFADEYDRTRTDPRRYYRKLDRLSLSDSFISESSDEVLDRRTLPQRNIFVIIWGYFRSLTQIKNLFW